MIVCAGIRLEMNLWDVFNRAWGLAWVGVGGCELRMVVAVSTAGGATIKNCCVYEYSKL